MSLGQTGLDVIGDSPTMSLMDADHPLALYTLGTQGVSLCRHDDYRELLDDIPLDQISIDSSSRSMFMVASLYLVAKERGISPMSLRGSVIEWPFYSGHCSMDFYEEIAKIRAMRRIFARMMKDEVGALDPRSQAVNIAVHTSGLSLTTEQPANNIVRGAAQTVALGLAGVSALEISTFDEGYRTPSKEAHMVGLRTQQIVDLESRGDPADLVNSGFLKQFFHGTMGRYHHQVHDGDVMKVGMNVHQLPNEEYTLLRDISEARSSHCSIA